jgi:uroporphyrinogen decarboxylase
MPRLLTRRGALGAAGLPLIRPVLGRASLSPKQRVDRALAGQQLDRPPISLWHHFHLEKEGPARHAEQTLRFHREYSTDLVKVMSDFPYPKPTGPWWNLREEKSPFAPQLEALRLIRDGLKDSAHFVETIFNPWNVAEKLSSKEAVLQMKRENPSRLLQVLSTIARSEANHARLAIEAGASGIFLAIANAEASVLSRQDYLKFSAPFDRLILEAVSSAPLNILHIHGAQVHLDLFYSGWPATVLNYSVKTTGVPLANTRLAYSGVLAGGIDETSYRTATVEQLTIQSRRARQEAGARFLLTPGCSVPDDATPAELRRLAQVFA